MSVWYTTREQVKAALDSVETARNNGQVDRAIAAATGTIEGRLHRRFYPWTGTRYFDWPNGQYARPWRLWLDQHELISVTSLSSGGVTIGASDYFLRPYSGPPYNRVEIDLDSSAVFGGGSTHQRDVTITGVWGYRDDESRAGTLAEALDASETAVDVTDSASIGVGSILRVDAERMIVTGKTMLDTGQNTGGALTASVADVSVTVATGSAYTVGETILIDGERMLIVDIAGNVLIVKRAWDGSVLASHSSGADIYAPRTLTVTRGALGTTAAAHDSATAVARHDPPPGIVRLATALALDDLLQQSSGYAREVGSGESQREASGRALRAVWDDAYTAYGRKARTRAV
ncbi:hypothetical protein E1258_09555 [Micromonospora sp. KC207]|uniref:hypothetical protein n=1 Tax=Micromonospora sp. KC207 TaxID=2530377 RepID=UPI00104356D3|nr:hypothetical protein [Micromonospora sp. KC207]TDC63881.1 hypothetical protein E1258_09555 [Micromonospora sp. KC207]